MIENILYKLIDIVGYPIDLFRLIKSKLLRYLMVLPMMLGVFILFLLFSIPYLVLVFIHIIDTFVND